MLQPLHIFIAVSAIACVIAEDVLREDLNLKPLANGYLQTDFQITVNTSSNFEDHYDLFPRSLGELLDKFGVEELHLTLSQGHWRHEKFGYSPKSAPVGLEIWASIDSAGDSAWNGLCQALSGLICASMERVAKEKITAFPSLLSNSRRTGRFRHAALPREVVCTENLTPWMKLLPCGGQTGVASLLKHSGKLLDSFYFSVGISYWKEEESSVQVLQLSLTTVHRVHSWSISKIFGAKLDSACPLAKSTVVSVDVSKNETFPFVLTAQAEGASSKIGNGFITYNLGPHSKNFDLSGKPLTGYKIPTQSTLSPITARRFLTGYGQMEGGLTTTLFNSDANRHTSVVYFQVIPWFIHVYLHTLRVTVNGGERKDSGLVKMKYVPGVDRTRPYVLETELKLCPRCTVDVSIEFERTFLKWNEYLPDASHGFYIPSGVLDVYFDSQNFTRAGITSERVHTEAILVSLPTPDFSMPYNAICLACTGVALAFGPMHNLTTKRLYWTTAAVSLKDRVSAMFGRLKGKFSRDKSEEAKSS